MPKQKEKLYFAVYKTIYEKAAKMDYEAYDNPEYYNDLVLAMNSMNERVDSVLSDAQDITRLLTSIISISAVIRPSLPDLAVPPTVKGSSRAIQVRT